MYMLQQPLFLSEIFNFHSFTLQFYDHTGIRPKNKLHNLFVVMFEQPSIFAESTKSVHIYFSVHVKYGNTGCEVFKRGGTKLKSFLPKNQHTQRKLLNFENWISGGLRGF